MHRSTIAIVAVTALSTAAMAQVGSKPVENKIFPASPAAELTPTPASNAATPSTDDAPPSARADAPASVTPAPGDPVGTTTPPPKR